MSHHPKLIESFMRIIRAVGDEFLVAPEEIAKKSRVQKTAEARFVALTLCKEIHGLTLEAAGGIFGLTHGAAIHAIKQVEHMRQDGVSRKRIESIRLICAE